MTSRAHESVTSGAAQPAVEMDDAARVADIGPKCAGVGRLDATCWLCKECAGHLCNTKKATMPPLALANKCWLGRDHPLYQKLSLGMRLALGRGRDCLQKLPLGQGPRDETQTGLTGNNILIAQPRAKKSDVPPDLDGVLDTLVVVFCRSIDNVEQSHVLTMERREYLKCAKLRKEV